MGQNSEPDREAQALARRRRDKEDADALTTLLLSMDGDGSGTVTLAELECHMSDEKVRAHLMNFGVDVRDVELFFSVLTHASGDESLAIDDFVQLCSRMRGTASGI